MGGVDMREHELKCWPSEFDAIARGEKTFEYRRNDRDYAAGDVLVLRKWDPHLSAYAGSGIGSRGAWCNEHGTVFEREDASTLRARVTSMLQGRFGVPENYCVMSIRLLGGDDHA
jgi:hypothetical protein